MVVVVGDDIVLLLVGDVVGSVVQLFLLGRVRLWYSPGSR